MSKLTDAIRAKHPGAYDDLDDASLEKSVLLKHPEYADMANPAPDTGVDEVNEAKKFLAKPSVTDVPPEPTPVTETSNPLKKIWDFANEPLTDAPSRFAHKVAEYIDPEQASGSRLKNLATGYIESLGHAISGLTSPLNATMAALSAGTSAAEGAGLSSIAKAANIGERVLSTPMVAQGAHNIYSGETIPDKLMGGVEAGLGAMGMRARAPHISEVADRIKAPESHIPIHDTSIIHDIPSELPVGESVKDISGREIAPPQSEVSRASGPWDNNIPTETPKTGMLEDELYQDTAKRLGMGLPSPETKANFAYHQPDYEGGSIPIYNVDAPGHPLHESSVAADTLRENGIEVPPTPDYNPAERPAKPLTLEERQNAEVPKEFGKNIPDNVNPETGEFIESPAPMFNRRGQTGETGNLQPSEMRRQEPLVTQEYIDNLHKDYEKIKPIQPDSSLHILDHDDIINPQIQELLKSPQITKGLGAVENVFKHLTNVADDLGWEASSKVKKFGLMFKLPDETGNSTLGIHIPNPLNSKAESSILLNLGEHLDLASRTSNPVDRLSTGLFTTMTHELAHVKGGEHDTGFAYRHATMLSDMGRQNTVAMLDDLASHFGDIKSGQYHPEVQKLLDEYNQAKLTGKSKSSTLISTGASEERPTNTSGRENENDKGTNGSGRPATVTLKSPSLDEVKSMMEKGYKFSGVNDDGSFQFASAKPTRAPILEGQIGNIRPTATMARQQLGPDVNKGRNTQVSDFVNLPRTMMASVDMSAPLRQGIGLIHKPQFWNALPGMVKAFGSEETFNAIQQSIAEKPLFKKRVGKAGKELPSFAEDAGLKLTDIHDFSKREEMFASKFANAVPGVRASNRAYVAFLNKLRADTFESLIQNAIDLSGEATNTGQARPGLLKQNYTPNEAAQLNPLNNVPLARSIAELINTATGRGSLDATVNIGGHTLGHNFEPAANLLGNTLFAPRLIASRMRILNPVTYIMAPPQVRMEALKSLFAITAAGLTVGQLGKMMGGKVESDPSSSDFGKVKMGDTRLDPFAGFQQYAVAANRLVTGMTKSSTTGHKYELGKKFGRDTRKDVVERFAVSKANPMIGFAYDWLKGKDFKGQPFNVSEGIASRFVPLFIQDLKQLATDNPNLLPGNADYGKAKISPKLGFAVPSFLGMGVQQYPTRDY